jgi:hypothetical protein
MHMVDYTSTFRVAAVQAEPVWFDAREAAEKVTAIVPGGGPSGKPRGT